MNAYTRSKNEDRIYFLCIAFFFFHFCSVHDLQTFLFMKSLKFFVTRVHVLSPALAIDIGKILICYYCRW